MKKILYVMTVMGLVFGLIYIGLWVYSVRWFKQEISNVYAHAASDGVEFLGPEPILTNFPFVPEIYYSVGIKTGNAVLRFPELRLRGYPIPFTILSLIFPKGISLDGIADPKIWSLDSLAADISIPYHLPKTFNYEQLAAWQESGGKIEVRHYELAKEALLSEGKGLLTLDENLQPVFSMDTILRGHELFIAEQKDEGLIDPFAAAVGTTMLNGFAKIDPKTNEKTVSLNVNVRDRMLSVGPLQVLPLPEIVWDRHTPPAPPQ